MASNARPPYGSTVLRGGSEGPDVALVQRWLNGARTRYPVLHQQTVDGKYGSSTATAVKTFQALVGLKSDGAVGQDTWDALYQVYANAHGEGEIWPGMTMRSGQSGATVRSAQQQLKKLVPSLTVDGHYGTGTRNAVFAYQVVHALTPDGVLGKDTWAHLFNRSVDDA